MVYHNRFLIGESPFSHRRILNLPSPKLTLYPHSLTLTTKPKPLKYMGLREFDDLECVPTDVFNFNSHSRTRFHSF